MPIKIDINNNSSQVNVLPKASNEVNIHSSSSNSVELHGVSSTSQIKTKTTNSPDEVNVNSGFSAAYDLQRKMVEEERKERIWADNELQAQVGIKQNLGYIIIDNYISSPDSGQIPLQFMAQLNTYLVNKISYQTQIYYLTLSDDNVLVYYCPSIMTVKNQITVYRETGNFFIESITTIADHSRLANLDFLNSGHTGFAGIEFGTTAEWNARPTYVPPLGMIIVYTDYARDGDKLVPGIKIGDGNAYLATKPFIGADLSKILQEHILDGSVHLQPGERERWNNKLNCELPQVGSDLLVFNRN